MDDNWWELLHLLVAEGDLLGRRVLDVGAGTGRLAVALAERGARVWGVDPSAEMLAEARRHAGRRVRFKRGEAERLPFKDGWFERVTYRLVVHLVDRSRAFAEAARVLGPHGRAVVASFDPPGLADWLTRLFPAVLEVDRRRFPSEEEVEAELLGAGFRSVRARRMPQEAVLAREDALERLRSRFISTLSLIPEADYRDGLARAERELPAEIRYRLAWFVLTAER